MLDPSAGFPTKVFEVMVQSAKIGKGYGGYGVPQVAADAFWDFVLYL